MTDTYLRSLGFAPLDQNDLAGRRAFDTSWRYQHECRALDGASLFIEHPLGVASCRLSALAAPLAAQDVFATTTLHDRPGLETAIEAFYSAHGGKGEVVPPFVPYVYRPFRRRH
ncbi:hypothetical protein [Solirubrum puertoriconensis]|uniref:Uncharacterized protein n=1 Tax=Solirubrum puertoriconensis TaxID=1751427 RepID=A0A9X0L5F1_SOLP1|nr:hypothetical protein [Solirubrum puertoriconensis]KUG08596.1 hypothetical protein ASU33_10625 [Solirubrum puertoriconensis]